MIAVQELADREGLQKVNMSTNHYHGNLDGSVDHFCEGC